MNKCGEGKCCRKACIALHVDMARVRADRMEGKMQLREASKCRIIASTVALYTS